MTTMYSLKPILCHDVFIDRPMCMYKMKNINGDGDTNQTSNVITPIAGQFIDNLKGPLAEVAVLEARQEKILEQLAKLKQQVVNLSDILKANNQSVPAVSPTPAIYQATVVKNLVVNVNPSRPCYSILALKELWKNVNFTVSPFIHSSVKLQPSELFTNTQLSSTNNAINLSLIWKDVTDVELIVSGIHGYIIKGEVNFLRYLVRTLNNESYEKSSSVLDSIQIDQILDLSHQMIYEKSSKDKQNILSLLDEKLGDNKWFCGKQIPGISDAAVWSALKQFPVKNISTNLMAHYKRCENTFLN